MSYMPTPLVNRRKRLADMSKDEYADYEREREQRYQLELIKKIIANNNVTSFDKRDFESLLQSSKEFKQLYEEMQQNPQNSTGLSTAISSQSQRSDTTPIVSQQYVQQTIQSPNHELERLRTENMQLKVLLQQEQQRRQLAEKERDELIKKLPRTMTPQAALQAAQSVLEKYADLTEPPVAVSSSRNVFSQNNQFIENDVELDNNVFDSQFLQDIDNDCMSTKEMNAPPAKIPQELFDMFE